MKTYRIISDFWHGKYAISFVNEKNEEVRKDFISKSQLHSFMFTLKKQGYKRISVTNN